jgi:hypothetical protein
MTGFGFALAEFAFTHPGHSESVHFRPVVAARSSGQEPMMPKATHLMWLMPLLVFTSCDRNTDQGKRSSPEMDVDVPTPNASNIRAMGSKEVGRRIFEKPDAFMGEVITICGAKAIDGPIITVGNMGRSPTEIWLDRPIRSASGCLKAKLVRASTPPRDIDVQDGSIWLDGWRLQVLSVVPEE